MNSERVSDNPGQGKERKSEKRRVRTRKNTKLEGEKGKFGASRPSERGKKKRRCSSARDIPKNGSSVG